MEGSSAITVKLITVKLRKVRLRKVRLRFWALEGRSSSQEERPGSSFRGAG